jgi:hypothetical protein
VTALPRLARRSPGSHQAGKMKAETQLTSKGQVVICRRSSKSAGWQSSWARGSSDAY